ncbi:MAG: hypothetical protein J0L93_09720 [Deltaproteobacteria bacterium]|nr:hypothetical protein [Deltaproteobacteria bacterium]
MKKIYYLFFILAFLNLGILSGCRSGHFDQREFQQSTSAFKANLVSSKIFDVENSNLRRLAFVLEIRSLPNAAQDVLIRNQDFSVRLENPALRSATTQVLKTNNLGQISIQAEFEQNDEDPRALHDMKVVLSSLLYGTETFSIQFQLSKIEAPIQSFQIENNKDFQSKVSSHPKSFSVKRLYAVVLGQSERSDLLSDINLQVWLKLIDTRVDEGFKNEKILISFTSGGQKVEYTTQTNSEGIFSFPVKMAVDFYDDEKFYELPIEVKLVAASGTQPRTSVLFFNFETKASQPLVNDQDEASISDSILRTPQVVSKNLILENIRLGQFANKENVFIDDQLRLFFQPHDELGFQISLYKNSFQGRKLKPLAKTQVTGKMILYIPAEGPSQQPKILKSEKITITTNENGMAFILLDPKVSEPNRLEENLHIQLSLEIPAYHKVLAQFFDIDLQTLRAIALDSNVARKNEEIFSAEISANTPHPPFEEYFKGAISLKEILKNEAPNSKFKGVAPEDELFFALQRDWHEQKLDYWKFIYNSLMKFRNLPPRLFEQANFSATSYDFIETISPAGGHLTKANRENFIKVFDNTAFNLIEDTYDFSFRAVGRRCLLIQFKTIENAKAAEETLQKFFFCQDNQKTFDAEITYRVISSEDRKNLLNHSNFKILLRGDQKFSDFKTLDEAQTQDIFTHPELQNAGILIKKIF